MTVPKVSVCIPAYNAADYIGEAISSVLRQTFENFELIVLDDCSTDDTAAVIAKFSDPRLRFIQQDVNLGAKGNWNSALSEARGEYIKILCSDDFIADRCLEWQTAVLDDPDNENVVLVTGDSNVIDADGTKKFVRRFPGRRGRWTGAQAVRLTVRLGRNIIGEPSLVLFRASAAKAAGEFDGTLPYVIDLDYWCRLLAIGNMYALPEVVSSFRISRGAWSFRLADEQTTMFNSFVETVRHGDYGVREIDWLIGRQLCALNTLCRKIFYKYMP